MRRRCSSNRFAHPRSALLAALIASGLVAVAAPARGAPATPPERAAATTARAQARALFRQGIAKFDQGYYRQAIVLFEKALKLFPSPKIHTRIALCHKWLGNNLKALEHYELYLKAVPTIPSKPADRVLYLKVKTEVRNLLILISQLELRIAKPAGAEIRVNGLLVGTAPLQRTLRLNPGLVNVTVIAKGYYTFKKDLKLLPSQTQQVRTTLIRIKQKIIHVGKSPLWKRWWFWTTLGVLVAGGTGLAVGLTAQSRERPLKGIPVYHDGLSVTW